MTLTPQAGMWVGAVHLATSNFTEQVRFYTFSLGLKVISQEEVMIRLGAGKEPLIGLEWDPAAFHEEGTTGLYHVAIRLPNRLELARVVAHLAENGNDFVGVADHGVSESFYLTDYDGNGLELYADRPAADWPRDSLGGLKMGTDPLDIDNLIGEIGAETPSWAGIAAGTDIGHVHLTVNDLKAAEAVLHEGDRPGGDPAAALRCHLLFKRRLPPPGGGQQLAGGECAQPGGGSRRHALVRAGCEGQKDG